MKKLITLGGILVGLFLIIIFYQPASVLAAQGDCHLEHCLVPAPTVYLPDNQTVIVGNNLNVVGLTWKRTIVKVYLDGVELPGVIQHDHEDYFAGFYVTAKIKPGQHYLYTIAHSEKPGWFDQSQESTYTYFTVKAAAAPVTTPQPRTLPLTLPEPEKVDTDSTPPVDYINQDDSATGTVAGLEVIQGNIEGGVSVEATPNQDNLSAGDVSSQIQASEELTDQNQVAIELQPAGEKDDLTEVLGNQFMTVRVKETAQRNRLIGFGVLALLIIGFIIGRWVSKNSIKNQFLKEHDDQLPPAPQPPSSGSIIIDPVMDDANNPPIDVIAQDEPVDLAGEPKDYWGTTGATPYTPYPLNNLEEKDSRPKDINLT
ncbi:MAG: hypothetical protein Q8P32_00470 [Candidatus Komeilibacteria bacterium]|nr:hypothetical protein [Candidatus Komeilibacteria bacterium]